MRNEKLQKALEMAVGSHDKDLFEAIALGRQVLYDALKAKGWYWDKKAGEFTRTKPIVSTFADASGKTTGHFTIRIIAHPETAQLLLDRTFTSLRRMGAEHLSVSNNVPIKNTTAILIFLRGEYLEGEENPK